MILASASVRMVAIKKINDFCWEVEKTGAMNVPGKIFASEKLIGLMKKDKTFEQVRNVATLPGIVKASIAMPDAHQGYGFSIGGVAAFDMEKGIISPGGVGYDINCSVRMLASCLKADEIEKSKQSLLDELFKKVPVGIGRKGIISLTKEELAEYCEKGAKYAVSRGFGKRQDYEKTEEQGCMKTADFSFISKKAIKRGLPQLGSLGAGNHFLELQKVEKIYDEKAAKAFGISSEGQLTVMVHCGSRGLGHQVASDYIKKMEEKYGYSGLADRELINAPIASDLGMEYFSAMSAAANFAFANKQIITHAIRKAFERITGDAGLQLVYDVCHNIAKIEKHELDGELRELCIHRKGATRSFGPGRKEIPECYRSFGQPVIIPGSMGTASYLLAGTEKAEKLSFGSTAHGAGRLMSRHEATKRFRGEDVKRELSERGISVKGSSWKGIAEESHNVYKDIDEVVNVSHKAGIGKLVAKLKPIGVLKG